MLVKVELAANPFAEEIVEFRVIISSQPTFSNIFTKSAAKQVWKSDPSVI